MEDRTCEAEGCGRRSCMPAPYPPRCAKHELEAVDRAQQEAADRMFWHGVKLYLTHLAP